MEKSFIAIAIVIVFLTGFGSGIRVELQASDSWVINLSSTESSSTSPSFFNNFPNSSVVMYTPYQHLSESVKSDDDMGTFLLPLADFRGSGKKVINLTEASGCNGNLLVDVDEESQSSPTVKDEHIIWNIRANRADFRVLTPSHAQNVLNLRLRKAEDKCTIDLILLVHQVRFDQKELPTLEVFQFMILYYGIGLMLLVCMWHGCWGLLIRLLDRHYS